QGLHHACARGRAIRLTLRPPNIADRCNCGFASCFPGSPVTPPLTLALAVERWPIAGSFAISRGSKTEALTVVVELSDGVARGRGECVPYARYGESVDSVGAQIEAMRPQLGAGIDRKGLQRAMPPGAARNALDSAFWDLEAKRAKRP